VKYQYNVFSEVVKKSLKYFILQVGFTFLSILLFFRLSHPIELVQAKYISFVGIPTIENFSSLHLITLYNTFFMIYIYIMLFNYEKFHSFENVALRSNPKKHFLFKALFAFIITLLLDLFYFSIVFANFKKHIVFNPADILNLIIYHTVLFISIYTLSYKYKTYKILSLIIFVLSILSIAFYRLHYCIIWIITLFIYNIFTMSFKNIDWQSR